MKKFEIGNIYRMRSIFDHECVWEYKVTSRTESTITITDGEETKVCRIVKGLSEFRGAETVRPLGKYAMCPVLSA